MSPASDGPVRVLLVEDALDQALLVSSLLQGEGGFEVTYSQDGFHAAQLLKERKWDLLITDLNLPGVDGFELCRISRTLPEPPALLVITGYTSPQYQEEAFRAGATEILLKPLNEDELLAKVRELTRREEAPVVPGARRTVLAVGGLVGDVEMGCGGTLLKEGARGAEIVIVPLCLDEMDITGAGLKGTERAAEILGARAIVDEGALVDPERRVSLLAELVRDLRPSLAFVPFVDDRHPPRREAFGASRVLLERVPTVLAYQTATTTLEFKPDRFEDIRDQVARKMEALAAYQAAGAARLDLAPRLAQAFARYWGRFERFGEVEPFEVLMHRD
ncbi:MAG: response regulator [Gemmatimonadetes bacterium]|nr:response regulator [Gemmatimonadota bacterium]